MHFLDESHAAKNWKSLTSAAARHVAPHCKYRWLLSGHSGRQTAPADLYTQVEILGSRVNGRLGRLRVVPRNHDRGGRHGADVSRAGRRWNASS